MFVVKITATDHLTSQEEVNRLNNIVALGLTALIGAMVTYAVLSLLGVNNPWPATFVVAVLSILLAYWQSKKSK